MRIELTVNGEKHLIEAEPEETLLKILRDKLGLTGAKKGCDTGTCGLCMVILDGETVKSCQIKAKQLKMNKVVTVEGLGKPGALHPLQKAFIEHDAVQCGFCTPAMLIVALDLLNRNPIPSREEITKTLSKVLCRCTGYIPIIRAIESLAEENKRKLTSKIKSQT